MPYIVPIPVKSSPIPTKCYAVDGNGATRRHSTIGKDPKNEIKCFRIGKLSTKLENNPEQSGFGLMGIRWRGGVFVITWGVVQDP